jgi:hypothetical protein
MNATNWTNAHMGEYHTWIALQPALAPADCRQEHEEDDDQTATRCVFWRERILVRLLRLGLRFDLDSLVVGLGQGGELPPDDNCYILCPQSWSFNVFHVE